MDRHSLERLLALGLSLEQIGARLDRHPATVAYWLRKFGLEAANRARHAPRGGLARDVLEELIADGLSVRVIAERLAVSTSTVKYWLRRHDLKTVQAERREAGRRAKAAGRVTAKMVCRHHGLTDFWLEGRGAYRCLACRRQRVAVWRRRAKQTLVSEAGGQCRICGYSRCVAALHFHHLDPAEKRFGLGREGVTRSLAEMRAEARRCVLLCANCHAEVEAGIVDLRAA